jgi:glycosyltransferase involved in cell wall biosynthesis
LAFWPTTWARRAGAFPASRSSTVAPDPERQEFNRQRRLLRREIAALDRRSALDGQGRGIVMAVGQDYLAGAWVALWLLRTVHRCRLPVEIWYRDDDDLPPHMRAILAEPGVEFRAASAERSAWPLPRTGFELKPFAVIHSRFAEVLALDADNVPLADPTPLFDLPGYRRTGALFWPDVDPVNPYNPIWTIAGGEAPVGPEWETGQLVINRRRHSRPLALTGYLNAASDFYCAYLRGHKDPFHLAWFALDAPCTLLPAQPAEACGAFEPSSTVPGSMADANVDPRGLWQHDFDGRRLFLHRTLAKWAAWGRNVRVEGVALHDECLAALEELRSRWDGYPEPRPVPLGSEDSNHGVGAVPGRYVYVRRGFRPRTLQLLPDGTIDGGGGQPECSWRLEMSEQTPTLVVSERAADTCRLTLESDGCWRGRWIAREQAPVELTRVAPVGRAKPIDRQRLLFVSPVMPSETGNGLAMRAARVLAELVDRYRVALLVVPIYPPAPSARPPDWLSERCDAVRVAEPPGGAPLADAAIDGDLRQSGWIEAAGRVFRGQPFDVIHVFRLAAVSFARPYLHHPLNATARWHLDLDDMESQSEARIARLFARNGREAERVKAKERSVAAARWEEEVLRAWDRVYVCSALDRSLLLARPIGRRAEVVVLPNVVALPDDPGPAPMRPPLTILMVGTFGYFPNADAARWLCREILPAIREQTPARFRICLIGGGMTADVAALRFIPEVAVVGPEPDLAPWYRDATLVVVPLRAGGGTRIKLLEALSYRRPVVSTRLGAEGLEVVDGQHLFLADRAHHFARQCVRLMTDRSLAEGIGTSGRQLIEATYTLTPGRPTVIPDGH